MKVRMKIQVSGTRNGRAWPARGEVLEVSDEEGAVMCANGSADPVAERKVEKAVAPDDSEKAVSDEAEKTEPPKSEQRRRPTPPKARGGRPRQGGG